MEMSRRWDTAQKKGCANDVNPFKRVELGTLRAKEISQTRSVCYFIGLAGRGGEVAQQLGNHIITSRKFKMDETGHRK